MASIVGRQLARNGTLPHACGEEGTNKSLMWDPFGDLATYSSYDSIDGPLHMQPSEHSKIVPLFYLILHVT